MKASRGVLLVALALLGVVAIRDVARLREALPWHQLYDFPDFYCAGVALDRGADAYRYEPLHRCEHSVNSSEAFRADPGRVVPAPQPPYDFPPFMLAARLNFRIARVIDAVAIVGAMIASVWGLALVVAPLDAAALALALPAGYVLLNAGQIVPFAVTALVFCGVALARRYDRLAGTFAALTLIEPHLGLPVCIATLCWLPRSRLSLLASVLVLATTGALIVGPAGISEYVVRVLPQHAASEIGYPYQYSLTYLLRMLGSPDAPALIGGDISYAAMLVLGVWLGGRVSRRLHRPELIAYVPGACSVVAGPFVHMVDLAFAIPATLAFAMTLQGRARNVAAVALCLLAVPWILVWTTKKLFLATLFVVGALLLRLRVERPIAIATFASIAASIYLLELAPPAALTATTPGLFSPSDLAQQAWHAYIAELGRVSPTWLIVKVPTWVALGGMLASCVAALREKPRAPARP